MRGTLVRCRTAATWGRIIPAHAGNSLGMLKVYAVPSDHPRACGELQTVKFFGCHTDGSSPRMRGTPEYLGDRLDDRRIIPAHAGNSTIRNTITHRLPDHPRACGELPLWRQSGERDCGSSPRMRGTHLMRTPWLRVYRIIPAHAGNSTTPSRRSSVWTDHPRACGELSVTGDASPLSNGSSPRMRGTRPSGGSRHEFDHGSSPRMRGTPSVVYGRGPIDRIIPAHAGNSFWPTAPTGFRPDHPRACGELHDLLNWKRTVNGSSPRMRGTHIVLTGT